MTKPWPPEELDLLLSTYLDGELDVATRMEVEAWSRAHPEVQERLGRLRRVQAAVAGLRAGTGVRAGWTARAYGIGLPPAQPALRRMMYLGLGSALARPRVHGHGRTLLRLRRRWRVKVRGG